MYSISFRYWIDFGVKKALRPGIEPGSPARKADILTTVLS